VSGFFFQFAQVLRFFSGFESHRHRRCWWWLHSPREAKVSPNNFRFPVDSQIPVHASLLQPPQLQQPLAKEATGKPIELSNIWS